MVVVNQFAQAADSSCKTYRGPSSADSRGPQCRTPHVAAPSKGHVSDSFDYVGLEIANASILPRYLVVDDKVAILDKDSKLHYATIELVRQQGADIVVSNGLLDGDKLIVSALDSPVDGMKLTLVSDKKEQQDPADKRLKSKLLVLKMKGNSDDNTFS